MKKKVSAFDAKTHLGQLLRDAEAGQSYVIVRHGKPVARLSPPQDESPRDFKRLADAFRDVRKNQPGGVKLRALIDEGRRH